MNHWSSKRDLVLCPKVGCPLNWAGSGYIRLAAIICQYSLLSHHNLTPRETTVLHLLSLEYTNQEIARKLNVSERTVRGHLETIYQKLNVKSRTGAVVEAIRLQLIPEE